MAGNNAEDVEGSAGADCKTNSTAEVPPEFLIKHPLQNTWSLWFYDNDRTKSWEENQIELTTFDTVEDFWRLYHHIKLPSELRQGHDYAVFKQGIRPMWEDDANKMGGRWLISLEKKQRNSDLDRFWLDVVLLLIGENFEHAEEICGAVVNVRPKFDKIAIWTADTSKQQANLEIGRKLKDQLGIHGVIGFQLHRDTMVKHSSATKNLYTV
ncbi:eukaryotic translation initiation factor 4E1-like [Vanessa tameamea]|uniref:eIF-4F 25 kDa subunit n=1 Tax=Vanessa tameamea TaxID=334116 RepID=A0A8B8HZ20_VANTA|nr:eukaryotic translation initiation factor 4E1-like [Vanessa tameamea]XP_046960660.1 eukaryotic translation initiation factor 4E1-like [Vanessa cardui]XP_047527205.1 eukaryotic translation initiation factor 4E1-like [Vanessa atalanta]